MVKLIYRREDDGAIDRQMDRYLNELSNRQIGSEMEQINCNIKIDRKIDE